MNYQVSSNFLFLNFSNESDSNQNVGPSGTKKAKPRLSKNVEQIEALLRRINEENKKTKEVLDNIQKGENNNQKNQKSGNLVDMQDLIDPEEEEKTKNLVNCVIPPIKTAIIEKTSTTFLGKFCF